ncbi:2OG-Fe dioxygenase family protein [Vibrio sp. ZSDE26]|uniref:2OG-Fe dioxygenase family protein n=1 Tax=Vibrio amylolyticus TaxID=2847292 RepID=A0A9X1XRF8_9VIBR|nr:2OG-Fe dioxygenase family protein [Vibrio amylolyticus]MCK6265780.1 2OG-Fe dioxygenase family protein [Vibrio amylolyticus]
MEMENKFLIEAFQTPKNIAPQLSSYFNDLPVDKYVDSDHRFRSYARFQAENSEIVRLPHSTFTQSSEFNRVVGDIERDFAEMDKSMIETPHFQHVLKSFMQRTGTDKDHSVVDVHQIRVTCDSDATSAPAPEGIHQDGYRFVGIFCVQRKNISGGYTQIFASPVEQHPHMNTVLEENQFVILNDSRYFHHISETLSSETGEKGVRDVFVFTA